MMKLPSWKKRIVESTGHNIIYNNIGPQKKWSVLEYWPYLSLVFWAAKHESNLHFAPVR